MHFSCNFCICLPIQILLSTIINIFKFILCAMHFVHSGKIIMPFKLFINATLFPSNELSFNKILFFMKKLIQINLFANICRLQGLFTNHFFLQIDLSIWLCYFYVMPYWLNISYLLLKGFVIVIINNSFFKTKSKKKNTQKNLFKYKIVIIFSIPV